MSVKSTHLLNPRITDFVESLSSVNLGTATTYTVNLKNGTLHKVKTSAATLTITLPLPIPGKSYTVIVEYTGALAITWAGGGTRKWAGGAAPAATGVSGKFDFFVFTCDEAGITFGRSGGGNY